MLEVRRSVNHFERSSGEEMTLVYGENQNLESERSRFILHIDQKLQIRSFRPTCLRIASAIPSLRIQRIKEDPYFYLENPITVFLILRSLLDEISSRSSVVTPAHVTLIDDDLKIPCCPVRSGHATPGKSRPSAHDESGNKLMACRHG